MNLFAELKRRNVFRVAVLYLVSGWLILQVGDVLFGVMGLPDQSLRIVLGILLLGFIPALVFAWAYELTPDGLRRERDVDRSDSVTGHTARKLDIAVIVLVVMAMGMLLLDRWLPNTPNQAAPIAEVTDEATPPTADNAGMKTEQSSDSTEPQSVAVLPFVNMSADPDQAYFSEGLSDTLIHVLAQVEDLKVAARTSSFAYRGQETDIREIAAQLGVASVLEGSVQRAGNQLRIIAQLIDAGDGTHLWSQTFDRPADDIFAIQDEIAQEVLIALKGRLLDDDSDRIAERYQPNLPAYQAFLQGRAALSERTGESLVRAEALFKRALELDPDYPLAMVNLADTYGLQTSYGGRPQPEALALSVPLVNRALEIEPGLGEAYTSRAASKVAQNQLTESIADFERAIELSPNYATAHHWYAMAQNSIGDIDAALAAIRKASELDPLSLPIEMNVVHMLNVSGQKDAARARLDHAHSIHGNHALLWSMESYMAFTDGDLGRAVYYAEKELESNPGSASTWGQLCFAQLSFPDVSDGLHCLRLMRQLVAESDVTLGMEVFAMVMQDEVTAALEKLGQYSETHDLAETAFLTYALRFIHEVRGEIDRAMQILQNENPELFGEDVLQQLNLENATEAVDLAFYYKHLGEAEKARLLASHVLPLLSGQYRVGSGGIGIDDVRAYVVLDQLDQAVATMEVAIDEGYVLNLHRNFGKDPFLKPLYNRADYMALRDQLVQHLAAQQAWLQAQPDRVDLDALASNASL